MAINYKQTPANAIANNTFIEVTKEKKRVGLQRVEQTIGLIGQGLTSASFVNGEKKQVFSASEVGSLYGFGSEIHNASKYLFNNAGGVKIIALPLKEDAGDTASAGSILFAGTATANGEITATIAGQPIAVTVATTDTAENIVDALVAANPTDSVVTLAKNGVTSEQLDITAKWKGVTGNDITIFVNSDLPTGIADATITDMAGGVGVPDVQDALDAVTEDEILTILIHPYTDNSNLPKVEAWESTRWNPGVKKGFGSITAKRGDFATVVTGLTANRNSWTNVIFRNESIELSISAAASAGGDIAKSAAVDPSLQFNGHTLVGLTPIKASERFSYSQRDSAQKTGCATMFIENDVVKIDGVYNTYQSDEFGAPSEYGDREFLSVTLMTAVVYDRDVSYKKLWSGAKLANDGTVVAGGQKVLTPEGLKSFLLQRYEIYKSLNWVEENFINLSTGEITSYGDTITVERDQSNANRLNAEDQIFRIGNARITAFKVGWSFAV